MKFIFFLLALLIESAICPAQNNKEIELKADAYLNPLNEIAAFSGNVLIVKDGKVLLNKSYGYADNESKIPVTTKNTFYLGSNSKTLTAIAIMILVDKGLLHTSDSLSGYIPGFSQGKKITIHQLLTHTSGIAYDLPFVTNEAKDPSIWMVHRTLKEQVNEIIKLPLAAEPGSKVIYSNNNYRLLAYIIEKVSGTEFGKFLQREIFNPVGMKNTAHDDNSNPGKRLMAKGYFPEGPTGLKNSFPMDWNNKIGHASVYSTTGDMQKLYAALFSGKIISKSSLEKMLTLHTPTGSYGYGLFVWEEFKNSVYGFNGRSPGFSSEIRFYKQANLFIALLSNNYSSPVIKMVSDLAAITLNQAYEPYHIGNPAMVKKETLEQYIGEYEGGPDFVMPNIKLKVTLSGDNLTILWQIGGGRESVLIPQEDGSFFDKTFWAQLYFKKNAEGGIVSMEYTSRGKTYSALKKK